MIYKDGVYLEVVKVLDSKKFRLKPSDEITHAMNVADALSKSISGKEMIVTAVFDGMHMDGSKHYSGDAFDVRKWNYTMEQLSSFISNLRDNLGTDYDIVIESTHIHIEYDPKKTKVNRHENEIEENLELAERKEKKHRDSGVDSRDANGNSIPGITPRETPRVGSDSGPRISGGRLDTRPVENRNSETVSIKNKTEREVDSLMKLRLPTFRISLNKIINLFKRRK
jgi:hypothetical protein